MNPRQLRWLEQLTHYNYGISYRPEDKNSVSVAGALPRKEEHKPSQLDETVPTTLFDSKWFIEIAFMALLDQIHSGLEDNEACYIPHR